MQFPGKGWKVFQQPKVVSLVVKVNLIVILGLLCLGISLGVNVKGAHAQSNVTQHTQHATQAHIHAYAANMPPTGAYNTFPYPWCTWWADERYHQLHGVYVPWTTQADAWEWTARAYQFGWNVSSTPTVGAIINLQPWVQGAYSSGHVGVVEQVLSNGTVIASSTAWGANPYAVTYWQFSPGPGVTFITW